MQFHEATVPRVETAEGYGPPGGGYGGPPGGGAPLSPGFLTCLGFRLTGFGESAWRPYGRRF
jgi:hypothetical protein